MLRGVVDQAACLRHPQLDPVMLEQRRHRRVLAAVERPLVLADHDRVPPPAWVRQLRAHAAGPATSPDPASPPLTPGRKTRTATRRAPVPCSPGGLTAPPTPPARPRRPQPRQLHGSPPALPSRRPPPAINPTASTWYQAPRIL